MISSESLVDQHVVSVSEANPDVVVSDPRGNQTDFYPGMMMIIPTQYISACLFPVLLALCTVGNILNIYVLARSPKICIKEVFLLSLAVSDLLVMWIALPRYLDLHQFVLDLNLSSTRFFVNTMGVFTWLQYTFQTTSDLILVLFSFERLAAFRFSEQHGLWRTRIRRSVFIVLGVGVFSAVLMSEQVIYYYMSMRKCGPQPGWLARWHTVQHLTDVLFPLVVAALLLLLNIQLILHITKVQDWTGRQLRRFSQVGQDSLRSSNSSKLAKMNRLLLGCVGMYFITQLPVMVSNVVDYFAPNFSIMHLRPVIWIITLVNYSINFFVYLGFSKSYRDNFFQLMKRIQISFGISQRDHEEGVIIPLVNSAARKSVPNDVLRRRSTFGNAKQLADRNANPGPVNHSPNENEVE